jgi:hypothetical protein
LEEDDLVGRYFFLSPTPLKFTKKVLVYSAPQKVIIKEPR